MTNSNLTKVSQYALLVEIKNDSLITVVFSGSLKILNNQ